MEKEISQYFDLILELEQKLSSLLEVDTSSMHKKTEGICKQNEQK